MKTVYLRFILAMPAVVLLVACHGEASNSSPSASTENPSYSTYFPLTENPISEGGRWRNGGVAGLDWTNVSTAPGKAYGTQAGSGFDDSFAFLPGVAGNNYKLAAHVFLSEGLDDTNREVELLLRVNVSPNNATFYECTIQHQGGYAQIVKWNGGLGKFIMLARAKKTPVPHDGDLFEARIVGNVITLSWNGVEYLNYTDKSNFYPTGSPGIGFYRDAGAGSNEFGFKDFTVTILK